MTATARTVAATPGGRSAGRPARRSPRGAFTLIELLVVLGLILAIGAIALPTVLEGVERRRFESAVDEAIGTLRLARAHARLESVTVEVVAIDDTDAQTRLLAREIDLVLFADANAEAADTTRPIGAPWSERTLAVGLATTDEEPAPEGEDVGAGGAGLPSRRSVTVANRPPADPLAIRSSDAARGRQEAIRIAIFAPDGSAPVAAPLRLRDEHGRRATVRVNPWTGLASLDRAAGGGPALGPISEALGDPPVDRTGERLGGSLDESGGGSDGSPAGAGAAGAGGAAPPIGSSP